jgi:hypothetical protein
MWRTGAESCRTVGPRELVHRAGYQPRMTEGEGASRRDVQLTRTRAEQCGPVAEPGHHGTSARKYRQVFRQCTITLFDITGSGKRGHQVHEFERSEGGCVKNYEGIRITQRPSPRVA